MKIKTEFDVTEMAYESNPLKLIKPSYNAFKTIAFEFLKLLGFTIFINVLLAVPGIIGGFSIATSKIISPASIGLILLSLALLTATDIFLIYPFVKISLAAARGASLPWRTFLPKNYKLAWDLFWTTGISGLIIILGFIAFLIPGIIFAIWYSQVQFVVVDEGLVGMKALLRSKELVHKRMMDMAGLFGLSQLANIISMIPVIGGLIYLAYSIMTFPLSAIRYIQLTQIGDVDRAKTTTNMWNYPLFIVFLISIVVSIAQALEKHK